MLSLPFEDGPTAAPWAVLTDAGPGSPAPPGLASNEAPPRPDLRRLRRDWSAVRGAQDLQAVFASHGLARLQALRLAAPDFAQAVDPTSAQQLLSAAAQAGVPIRVSRQPQTGRAHTRIGRVRDVHLRGPWLLAWHQGAWLRVREDEIGQAWIVRHPTAQGLRSSLELFDKRGRMFVRFSDARHPESCAWRELMAHLPGEV